MDSLLKNANLRLWLATLPVFVLATPVVMAFVLTSTGLTFWLHLIVLSLGICVVVGIVIQSVISIHIFILIWINRLKYAEVEPLEGDKARAFTYVLTGSAISLFMIWLLLTFVFGGGDEAFGATEAAIFAVMSVLAFLFAYPISKMFETYPAIQKTVFILFGAAFLGCILTLIIAVLSYNTSIA